MPELRRDPLTGHWVVIAPARAARPEAARAGRRAMPEEGDCPFCSGNEAKTPPEIAAVRQSGGAADGPGWLVRVVPNLYPAFTPDGDWRPPDAEVAGQDPLHQEAAARGVCEVIVHSPDHRRWLPYLSAEQARLVMTVTWQRYLANANDRVGAIVALYNHGAAAGASLPHPHGQLYATAVTSPRVDEEVERGLGPALDDEGCVLCRTLAAEEDAGVRVIAGDRTFVAIAPWASRTPYETWIIPRTHRADFGAVSEDEAAAAGAFLRIVLWRISGHLGDPDLNWYIHSRPHPEGRAAASYHWHIEIRPRLVEVAGYEMATDIQINTVAPETAAAELSSIPEPGPGEEDPPVTG